MKKNVLASLIMLTGAVASTTSYAACLGNVYSMNAGRGHVGALIDIKESAYTPGSTYTQDAATRAEIHSKALFSSSAMAYNKNTDRIYYANVPAPTSYHMANAETLFTEDELRSLDFHAKSSSPSTLAYFDVGTQEHVEVAKTKFGIYRMAFHPETGELYASDSVRLFKVNPETGEVNQIALLPLNARAGGFTNWGDFEFYNNELLYVTNGRTFVVDLDTAALTLKAFHFVDFVTSVTTDQNGQLIMAAKNQNVTGNVNSNHLWRFKPETGEKVQVGLFPTRISAMATVTSEEHTCYERTIFPSDNEDVKVEVDSITPAVSTVDEGKATVIRINFSEATPNANNVLLLAGETNLYSASADDFDQNIVVRFSNGTSVDATLLEQGVDIALPKGVTFAEFEVSANVDSISETEESFNLLARIKEAKNIRVSTVTIVDIDSGNGANVIPVAQNDSVSTFNNATLSNAVPQATDSDGTVVSYQVVQNVGLGSLSFNANGSYTFVPGSSFADLTSGQRRVTFFNYTATDNDGGVSLLKTVLITVFGTDTATPNANPVAYNGSASTNNDTTLNSNVPAATDSDGTVVSYNLVQNVSAGSLSFNANGSYTFVPGSSFSDLTSGQSRNVTFRYLATDNDGAASEVKTITISVHGTNVIEPNVKPIAYDGSTSTSNNATLNNSVPAATDSDGSIASYQLVQNVSAGSLSFNANGSYSFVPGSSFSDLTSGQSRNVSFSYTATDNDGAVSLPKTITITVLGSGENNNGFFVTEIIGRTDLWEPGAPSGQQNGATGFNANVQFSQATTTDNMPIYVQMISGSAKVGVPTDSSTDISSFRNTSVFPSREVFPYSLTSSGTRIVLPKGSTAFGIFLSAELDRITEGNETFTIGAWSKADKSDYQTHVITIHDHDSN
ncbi:Ig-like domain-containing protein [Enterovibrio sp. 27052020O]|uniref:Ig-like domain-containing protein n=1 Tax=Enterovibrio sp. 27052020O TaxID=3241166 RepID=UPI00388DD18B